MYQEVLQTENVVAKKTHISVKGLNVHIGSQHILKDIYIDIPDKKVTSIIGPSGCGKTTLLKTFNRLLDNSSDVKITGQVLVDGENIYDPNIEVTRIRKKMGLLSQRPCPLPMSIYDNVAYGPRIHGTRKKAVLDELVEKQLRATGLWEEVKDRLNASANRLSIGQQQRLCIARAIAMEPEVILFDEPTSALDPISTASVETLFHELKENFTLIIVTHNMQQAARVSDKTAFFYMGELVEYDDTKTMFTSPSDARTQNYITGRFS